jgi:hypothetical protein
MAVTLNASTSSGLVQTADTSGEINIQSNGTTVLGVTSTGIAVTGTHSVTGTQSVGGNLSFNSGYGSSAVAYGCRAWVNFDGTGTPAIRASGNVSSITDNGTGNYTVNFTTAMPDANYAIAGAGSYENVMLAYADGTYTPTTTSVKISVYTSSGNVAYDGKAVSLAVFR